MIKSFFNQIGVIFVAIWRWVSGLFTKVVEKPQVFVSGIFVGVLIFTAFIYAGATLNSVSLGIIELALPSKEVTRIIEVANIKEVEVTRVVNSSELQEIEVTRIQEVEVTVPVTVMVTVPVEITSTPSESLGPSPTPSATFTPTSTPPLDITFTDNFNAGMSPNWDIRAGNWFTVNGASTLRDVGSDWTEGLALIGDSSWTNYTISVEINMNDDQDNTTDYGKMVFLLLRVQDEANYIALRLTDGGFYRNAAWFIMQNGILSEVGNTRQERFFSYVPFIVQIEVRDDFFVANVDGTEMSFSGAPFMSGGPGLRIYTKNTNEPPTFDNFAVRPLSP